MSHPSAPAPSSDPTACEEQKLVTSRGGAVPFETPLRAIPFSALPTKPSSGSLGPAAHIKPERAIIRLKKRPMLADQ